MQDAAAVIEIELNGAPHTMAAQQRVRDLIVALGLAHQSLAVAINREVVPRHRWGERVLEARDRVEVVRAIGGG